MNWEMVFAILGGMVGILALYSGFMVWFMTRIENRLDTHISDSQKSFNALGIRIDAMGSRIDQTQAIIMRMLEKQGR